MKKVRVITRLDFGIFPGYCHFSCGYDYHEIIHYQKDQWLEMFKAKKEDIIGCANLASMVQLDYPKTGESKKFYLIVFKDPFDFSDYFYSKLAHEILHIIQFYTPDVFDRNREIEAEAYLHTHLMTQALKAIRGN